MIRQLKFKGLRKKLGHSGLDVDKLKSVEYREKYKEIHYRLKKFNGDVENDWNCIKEVVSTTAVETLAKSQKADSWITLDRVDLI